MIKLKQVLVLFLDMYVIQVNKYVGAVKVKVCGIGQIDGVPHFDLSNGSTVPVETHSLHTKFGANRRVKKIDAENAERLKSVVLDSYPDMADELLK